MTDQQLDLCRTIHWLEQGHAKLIDGLWRSCRRGSKVKCVDDRLGANFLRRGQVYTVDQIGRNESGWFLHVGGVAIAFSADKFERVIE